MPLSLLDILHLPVGHDIVSYLHCLCSVALTCKRGVRWMDGPVALKWESEPFPHYGYPIVESPLPDAGDVSDSYEEEDESQEEAADGEVA